MPLPPLALAARTLACSLALLLVMTGCGSPRDPAAGEERIVFDFCPDSPHCSSFRTGNGEPASPSDGDEGRHGGGGGGRGGGGGCSFDLGHIDCGGDGRGALIVLGVIVVVVVVIVIADVTARGVHHLKGTSYYLHLEKGTLKTTLPLRQGVNRLNIPRELADGLADGTASADILAKGRRHGLAPFTPHLAGGVLQGW